MPSAEEKPTTLYDKVYAAHVVAEDTIYIDRYAQPRPSHHIHLLTLA